MKLLVTGSTGRIGRELVRNLLEAGHELKTFDRAAAPRDLDAEHLPGDLRDIFAVRRAMAGVDAVMHLGAASSDGAALPEDLLSTNVTGTLNVLLAGVEAGVERLVFFSSVNALGYFGGRTSPPYFPVDDFMPRRPTSPYQLSKHLGEEACRSFTERHGMVTIGLRPALVADTHFYERWGGHSGDRRAHWWRNDFWAYVDLRDVCQAALLALEAPGVTHDSFLLCADDTNTDTPTAELVAEAFPDVPWKTHRSAYFDGQPYRSLVDCSHAKRALGWQPQHSWREAHTPE